MRFNDPLTVNWHVHMLDLIMLSSTLLILVYAIRQYRSGRPTYLVLWLGSISYGLIMELTTGMMVSRSYIQGEFTVMIATKELLGYSTDMPLYVLVAFYPVYIFFGLKLIEAFGIRSILARSVAVGVFMLLIDAPYEVNGVLAPVKWWTWLDWQIGGRHIFQSWYGWPMTEALWQLTWPGFMMWMVWHWEKRYASDERAVAEIKGQPWRTLLLTPLVLGLLLNTFGFVLDAPIGIAMALNWPHFPVVLAVAALCAAVLLYSAKDPVGLDRVGWVLVAIQTVGYGIVTLADSAIRPVPTGQMTISFVSFAVLVGLAAYPAHRRRQQSATAPPQNETTKVASPVG